MIDEGAGHFLDRIEIELHDDPRNLAKSIGFSIPLYRDDRSKKKLLALVSRRCRSKAPSRAVVSRRGSIKGRRSFRRRAAPFILRSV